MTKFQCHGSHSPGDDLLGIGAERNAPCRCGSGLKSKKCCLLKQPLPSLVVEQLRSRMLAQTLRKQRYGNIRPLITATHKGHRFIVVGSRLYYNKEWRTFTDFLLFYVRDVMGKDWWETESAKKGHERHQILRWFDHFLEVQRAATRHEDGLLSSVPDGIISSLLLLAYDLYVLRDHAKLQDEVIKRLRHRDQLLGARYELFVAATFIRAGCQFSFEDESDTSKKHAEFIATDPVTGFTMAVEAKAKQSVAKATVDLATIRPSVKQLLDSAAAKQPEHPLIVWVELNLPPEPATEVPKWVPHVDAVVRDVALELGASPFAAVFFTNRPHTYGEAGEPDPSKHYYGTWPPNSTMPEALIDRLGLAATQYGNVPSEFPPDFATVDGPSEEGAGGSE